MKALKIISISFIVLAILYYGLILYAFSPQKGGKYYFPEKYGGWVCVSYEAEGMPPLEIQDEFLIYKIPESGILKTSSEPRLSPTYNEYYYYTEKGVREAEEIGFGGGFTSQMEGEKMFTSYFWISSGDVQEDYEKYVKDRPRVDENGGFIDPVCGRWKEDENETI